MCVCVCIEFYVVLSHVQIPVTTIIIRIQNHKTLPCYLLQLISLALYSYLFPFHSLPIPNNQSSVLQFNFISWECYVKNKLFETLDLFSLTCWTLACISNSFPLLLSSIPLFGYIRVYSTIHPLDDSWVGFKFSFMSFLSLFCFTFLPPLLPPPPFSKLTESSNIHVENYKGTVL